MTGRVSLPQPKSPARPSRWQPPIDTQASQSAYVTSNLETANGLAIVTLCCGPSLVLLSVSVAGDPIVNSPAGTTTIQGQSLAHSRKASFGLRARSASGLSTYGSKLATR